MDNAEAMYFVVAGFLVDHHVVYGEPSLKGEAMCDAELEDFGDAGEYVLWSRDIGGPVEVVVEGGKCLHMAEVASGWGSRCCLTPFSEDPAQIFDSNVVICKVGAALFHVCDEEVGGG